MDYLESGQVFVDEGRVAGGRAVEASFGIGEKGQANSGGGTGIRAALVGHCVLASLSCLPAKADERF